MKNIIVIPSRYSSKRFPGKPLVEIDGKSMIKRVYDICLIVFPAEDIYCATESELIAKHCYDNNIQFVMTSDKCLTGTDRVAEVAQKIYADNYINIQGDEPLFNPEDIKLMVKSISLYPNEVLNGFCKISSPLDYFSSTIPKVVFNVNKQLLYMSRSPIPGNKNKTFTEAFRQVCAYVFPRDLLLDFSKRTNKSHFEEIEDIEILRFIELGIQVRMIELSDFSISVDYKEDLLKVIKRLKS